MADGDHVAGALDAVMNRHPKHISYSDYKPTKDFNLWLAGLRAKIRGAYGYKHDDENKVQDEVVKLISSKLSAGNALDAYERLDAATKGRYTLLVKKLTEEFVDPYKKRRFNTNLDYNTRKKEQGIKEFMQEIKNDMTRYSDLAETTTTIAGGIQKNPEREKQGVIRFRHGMRDDRGKKDEDLIDHLEYHLMEDTELTWENAVKIATRYEMARARRKKEPSPSPSSSSSSSDSSDSADDVKAMGVEKKKKKKKKSKKKKSKDKEVGAIASLSDQVHENQMEIQGLKTAQNRMAASQEAAMKEISGKLEHISNNMTRPQQQQQQQQQPQRNFQPRQQLYVQNRPQNNQNFSPRNVTWVGKTNQPRQGNFGFQRRTPASLQTAPKVNAAPRTAANPVAAVEEVQIAAENLDDGDDEEVVAMKMSDYLCLIDSAGAEVPEDCYATAVSQQNFD